MKNYSARHRQQPGEENTDEGDTGADAALPPARAVAQTPPAPPVTEEITVVATSPLIGGGVSRNLVPADTQVLGAADISRNGAPDALAALSADIAGINLDSAAGNPYPMARCRTPLWEDFR